MEDYDYYLEEEYIKMLEKLTTSEVPYYLLDLYGPNIYEPNNYNHG